MRMQAQIEPRGTFLHVLVTGPFEPTEAKQLCSRVLDSCLEHDLSKVLADIRPLRGDLSVMDKWNLMNAMVSQQQEYIATRGLMPIHLAYVGTPEVVGAEHFGATVGANRGLSVRSFTELQEALDWLGVGAADSTGIADAK